MSGKLIIVRHTESVWNGAGRWTGLTDVHLDDTGVNDAIKLGGKLKDIKIDYAYVSMLDRSLETFEAIMVGARQPDIPFKRIAAINERDYGVYTGKNKWQVKKEVGEETFQQIRRGWNFPVPGGETLKDVYDRSVPWYERVVVPRLRDGQNILISSHGNSIRAMIKYIESLSDEQISKTEMIIGQILIYTVDKNGKKIDKHIKRIQTQPSLA